MSLRERRLVVTAAVNVAVMGIALGITMLGLTLDMQMLFDVGGMIAILWLLLFRRLALGRLMAQRIVGDINCDRCGLTTELTDAWRCGCGFISTHRPQHLAMGLDHHEHPGHDHRDHDDCGYEQ